MPEDQRGRKQCCFFRAIFQNNNFKPSAVGSSYSQGLWDYKWHLPSTHVPDKSSEREFKQSHLSRRQFQEVNCSHTVQYRRHLESSSGSLRIQFSQSVLLFAIPWTSAHHCILNPHKSKLPWKSPLIVGQNDLHLKHLQRIWAAERMEANGNSPTLWWGCKWVQNYQKQQGGSLSDKHSETIWPGNPRSGLRPRKKSEFSGPCTLVFRAALLTMAKREFLQAKNFAFSAEWSQIKNTETEFEIEK